MPDLQRFVDAQDAGGIHDRALAELRAGAKRSHWMWFVFPQLRGLGHSEMALRYSVADLDEAREYLKHPVLGARLHAASEAVLHAPGDQIAQVLGSIDALKLRSSMTLFAEAEAAEDSLFGAVLVRWHDGERDPETLRLLGIA